MSITFIKKTILDTPGNFQKYWGSVSGHEDPQLYMELKFSRIMTTHNSITNTSDTN